MMIDGMNFNESTIGVVIPTLNEEHNLPFVLNALKSVEVDTILVIDGKSTDKTIDVANSYGADVILQNGKGKGDAICQVFSNGYLNTDIIVLMDADGSMDPNEIPIFVKKLNSGFDLIKGSRFIGGGYSEDMSILRRIGNLFFATVIRLLWGKKYTDLCYGYLVMTKECVKKLSPILKAQNFEFETEVFIKARKLGLKVAEVPSVELKRKYGKSNLRSFTDGFSILKKILSEILT